MICWAVTAQFLPQFYGNVNSMWTANYSYGKNRRSNLSLFSFGMIQKRLVVAHWVCSCWACFISAVNREFFGGSPASWV